MRGFLALTVIALLAGCAVPASVEQRASRDASGPDASSQAALGQLIALEAKAKDGVSLRGHVYLPDGPGPFATILVYSPYWNGGGDAASDRLTIEKEGRKTIGSFLTPFMDAGFAVALANLRGTGLSDGCYQYMNHAVNGPDANAVIDSLAAQPWSNGNVGMYGISYMGAVQYAAIASGASPHLKAIVPVSGEWDEWNLLGRWGVGLTGGSVHPFNRVGGQGLGTGGPIPSHPPRPAHLCPESVIDGAGWSQLSTVGDKDAFLKARDLRSGIAQSTVPVFATNGLTNGEGHILQFEGLWDMMPDDRRLLIGQWPHAFPREDAQAFGKIAADWFDGYLRGGQRTVAPGIVEYEDDAQGWHTTDRWPPPANETQLFLSDGTLVLDSAQVRASQQRFVSWDLFPEVGLGCGTHQAAYVSPPLAEDVIIAGNFFVDLTLMSTLADGNLVAALWRTNGDGDCVKAATATTTVASPVRFAVSDLYHRGFLEVGRDFPVGSPSNVTLRSLPLAAKVPAGERLVLVIGGGAPDFVPDVEKPVITVHSGPGIEARLRLPIVEGTLTFRT